MTSEITVFVVDIKSCVLLYGFLYLLQTHKDCHRKEMSDLYDATEIPVENEFVIFCCHDSLPD